MVVVHSASHTEQGTDDQAVRQFILTVGLPQLRRIAACKICATCSVLRGCQINNARRPVGK